MKLVWSRVFLSIQFYINPTSKTWETRVDANYTSSLAITLSSIGFSLQEWLKPTLCVTWFILYALPISDGLYWIVISTYAYAYV